VQILSLTVLGKEWTHNFAPGEVKIELEDALNTANFLTNIPEFLWNIIPYPRKDAAVAHINGHRQKAVGIIKQIRESDEKEGDSMIHFLVHHEAKLSDQEILDELFSLTAAGHESK
jgi:cytochrome P450